MLSRNKLFTCFFSYSSLLFFIFFFFNYILVFGQSNKAKLGILEKSFHNISEGSSGVSIYVQTTKGIYETGEDLFFRATALDAQNLIPSSLDKTLFVKLTNIKNDSTVWQEKYKILNGFSDGHIYLDSGLEEGDYVIEVFSKNSFYRDFNTFNGIKIIKIVKNINTFLKNNKTTNKPNKSIPKVHFELFPEGGYLVNDLLNKVAFKAIDSLGNPVDIAGELYENNRMLLEFNSIHAGMGAFEFSPKSSNTYAIRLNSENYETDKIYSIPEIKTSGTVMQIIDTNDKNIAISLSSTNANPEQIFLRVQTRGKLSAIASGTLKSNLVVSIPTTDFTEGICEITLFDNRLIPIAERLIYYKGTQKLKISADTDKKVYNAKDKVTIKIKTFDTNNEPIKTTLGISIYDNAYTNIADANNILTFYHLSSQLKGRIYDPNYYFDEKNNTRNKKLDLLMLTQGWRRYIWSEPDITKRNQSAMILEDGISGSVKTLNKKRKTPEQKAVLLFTPIHQGNYIVPLDNFKNFYLSPKELELGRYFYIKRFGEDDGSKVVIKTNDGLDFLQNIEDDFLYLYPRANVKVENYKSIEPLSIRNGVNLNEVTVKSREINRYRDKYLGRLDSIAKLNFNMDYVCTFNYLNCEVHPNDVQNRRPKDNETYEKYIGFKWNADGTFRYNAIIKERYKYPVFTEAELLEKFKLTKVKGYYPKREFYQPNYDSIDTTAFDNRNTLFWSPTIETNKDGEVVIDFFTSDIASEYVCVIEGIGSMGLLAREKISFYVSRN